MQSKARINMMPVLMTILMIVRVNPYDTYLKILVRALQCKKKVMIEYGELFKVLVDSPIQNQYT